MHATPMSTSNFGRSLAYAAYGTDKSFLRRVAQVSPSSTGYPTRANLIDAHVLDAVSR
jgi:hypothetical protein